jgi:hypothetical protein
MSDGFAPPAQIAFLKTTRWNFRKNGTWWRKLYEKFILNSLAGKDETAEELALNIDALMDGTWELIHGIALQTTKDGKKINALSKKEYKILFEKFKYYGLQQHFINRFTAYGLGWFPIASMKGLATFTGAELEMRTEVSYLAAKMAKSLAVNMDTMTQDEQKAHRRNSPFWYVEPAVLNVVRQAVYNTMFGMSQAFMSKAFRGYGKLILLFKGFTWQQLKTDWNTVQNYRNIKKGQRIIEGSIDNIKGDQKVKDAFKRYVLWRAIPTLLAYGMFYIPFYTTLRRGTSGVLNQVFQKVGIGFRIKNAIGRGVTTPLVAIPMQMLIMVFYAFGLYDGHEDEEELDEEVKKSRRDIQMLFAPLALNIIMQTIEGFADEESTFADDMQHMTRWIPAISDIYPSLKYLGEKIVGEEE